VGIKHLKSRPLFHWLCALRDSVAIPTTEFRIIRKWSGSHAWLILEPYKTLVQDSYYNGRFMEAK
jgi:hypothetical protein